MISLIKNVYSDKNNFKFAKGFVIKKNRNI